MKCTDKTGRTDNFSKPDGYTAREWARVQTQEAAEKKKQFRLLLITVLLAALTARRMCGRRSPAVLLPRTSADFPESTGYRLNLSESCGC